MGKGLVVVDLSASLSAERLLRLLRDEITAAALTLPRVSQASVGVYPAIRASSLMAADPVDSYDLTLIASIGASDCQFVFTHNGLSHPLR